MDVYQVQLELGTDGQYLMMSPSQQTQELNLVNIENATTIPMMINNKCRSIFYEQSNF